LAALAAGVDSAADALSELLVAFPVYRSYLPTGASDLRDPRSNTPARPVLTSADSIDALAARLADPADEMCVRFPADVPAR